MPVTGPCQFPATALKSVIGVGVMLPMSLPLPAQPASTPAIATRYSRTVIFGIARLLATVRSDVDVDLLEGQFAIPVRVRRGEVPEERVDVLVEREPIVALLAGRLDHFGTHDSLEFLDRENPVLVLVAEEEDLDDALIELLSVDLAVVILVVFLEPFFQVRRRSRLGGYVGYQENAERDQGPEAAIQSAHSMSPHQLS